MTPILNREFQHPTDGWYMIEPHGEHLNRSAGVLQVIDAEATQAIANDFKERAQAEGFPGLLVDHEHFAMDPDKESRAYGWLHNVEARPDGLYGQIRWTETGKKAVDGGDYRFFSTVYDPAGLAPVANDAKEPKRLRPVKLAGLTLTNVPNNKGGKPITNRADEFPPTPSGDQAAITNTTKTNTMSKLNTLLGLAADASEDAIAAEVTKLQNRNTTLEATCTHLAEEQAEQDLAPIANRITPEEKAELKTQLIANRKATLPLLKLVVNRDGTNCDATCPKCGHGFNVKNRATPSDAKVLNRDQAKTPTQTVVDKAQVLNRAVKEYKDAHNCTYERAFNAVREAKPELFKNES